MTLIDWWSLLGPLGMIMALVALALISRRLGHVTRMRQGPGRPRSTSR